MVLAGGFSDIKAADPEVQALFSSPQALTDISAKLGKEVSGLTVEAYRTQVVAGLNYAVKATLAGGETVVIKAFKPLPHTGNPMEIKSVEAGAEL